MLCKLGSVAKVSVLPDPGCGNKCVFVRAEAETRVSLLRHHPEPFCPRKDVSVGRIRWKDQPRG